MSARKKSALAIAAALVVAFACSSSPEAHAATAADTFRTLPPQAEMVFGADLTAARGSFLYDKLVENVDFDGEVNQWAIETGFDPRTDIDSITGVMWGEPSAGSSLIVVLGRFDLAPQAMAKLEEVGAHRGVAIYAGPDVHEGAESAPSTFAFPDDGVALVGSQAEVVNAIERRLAGGPSLADNVTLTTSAEDAGSRGQLWMVSSEAPGGLQAAMPQDLDPQKARLLQIMATMRETVIAVDILRGFRLEMGGRTEAPEDAAMLAQAAKGMVAMARISLPPEDRDLMGLLDQIEVNDNGGRFEASVELDQFQVEKLFERMDERHGSAEPAE